MNINNLKRMESLLDGDFKDFQNLKESEVVVEKEVQLDLGELEVEEDKTIVEHLFESFDKYNSLLLTESDNELIEQFGIADEIFAIQESLDVIREKIVNESVSDIVASTPVLLPIIASGIAGVVGWILKRKAGGDSAIPRPVVNTMFAINQYVQGGKEAERREIIKNAVLKANPNLDKKQVESAIDIAIKNADNLAKIKKPQGSAKHGTYETDFMKAQKERDRQKNLSKA